MKYPDPYFKDVPEIGNLSIEYVIVEEAYPLLFIAIDNDIKRYLCVCCDIREAQRWIINKLPDKEIRNLFLNQLSLKDAFLFGEWPKVLVSFDYKIRKDEYVVVNGNDIPQIDLPSEGENLDEELSDHISYILKLYDIPEENFELEEPEATINTATFTTELSVDIPIKTNLPTNYSFSEHHFPLTSAPQDDDLFAA